VCVVQCHAHPALQPLPLLLALSSIAQSASHHSLYTLLQPPPDLLRWPAAPRPPAFPAPARLPQQAMAQMLSPRPGVELQEHTTFKPIAPVHQMAQYRVCMLVLVCGARHRGGLWLTSTPSSSHDHNRSCTSTAWTSPTSSGGSKRTSTLR